MSSLVAPVVAPIALSELRVALVSDAVPDRNGVGTYYRDLCSHLQQHVEKIELFCPEQTQDGWRDPIRLPLPGDATQKICIPNPRRLGRRFAALKPNAVVVSTPGPYGFIGLRLAIKHKAKVVVGFHTNLEKLSDLYWKDAPVTGAICKWYLESGQRILFRYGTTAMVNSTEMIGVAEKLGARDVGLMGTTIARPFILNPVVPLRAELKVVTFAGRLAAEKNLGAVIDAAEELPGIEFRIAGDGPERELVVAATERIANLSYLGWLPREQMPELIDSTDMLVLPSHVESFGTIALEAMVRNRLVLVSADCGITQWPKLNQGLFQMNTDESLADAVARIAGMDPQQRQQTAALALAAARELNEWTVNHWLEVLARPVTDRQNK